VVVIIGAATAAGATVGRRGGSSSTNTINSTASVGALISLLSMMINYKSDQEPSNVSLGLNFDHY